jgi:hypothetical protein
VIRKKEKEYKRGTLYALVAVQASKPHRKAVRGGYMMDFPRNDREIAMSTSIIDPFEQRLIIVPTHMTFKLEKRRRKYTFASSRILLVTLISRVG